MRNPLVVLAGGAGLVFTFVLALSALVFEPPVDPADVVAAQEDPESDSPDVTLPGSGALEITGERQDVLTMGVVPPGMDPALGFVDPFTATTSDGTQVTMTWERDPEGALYLRHFMFDGLDFFLDPGECTLTPGEIGEGGVVPVTVECVDIRDIRGTATITMAGRIGFSHNDFPPPGITLGGEVVVGGDIEAELTVDVVDWVVRPDDSDPAFALSELSASTMAGETFHHLDFGRGPSGELYVMSFQFSDPEVTGFNFPYFEFEPGECPATEELVQTTGPSTAVYEVSFSCPPVETAEVEGGNSNVYTITVAGSFTGHRLDLTEG